MSICHFQFKFQFFFSIIRIENQLLSKRITRIHYATIDFIKTNVESQTFIICHIFFYNFSFHHQVRNFIFYFFVFRFVFCFYQIFFVIFVFNNCKNFNNKQSFF